MCISCLSFNHLSNSRHHYFKMHLLSFSFWLPELVNIQVKITKLIFFHTLWFTWLTLVLVVTTRTSWISYIKTYNQVKQFSKPSKTFYSVLKLCYEKTLCAIFAGLWYILLLKQKKNHLNILNFAIFHLIINFGIYPCA